MKTCTKCGEELSIDNFHKNNHSKDGFGYRCKACKKEHHKQWREANKEHHKQYHKQWRDSNKEHRKQYYKQWYKFHGKQYQKQWWEANKERIVKYRRQRLQTDSFFRFVHQMRAATRTAFSRCGFKKDSQTAELLGADWQTVKNHIESQFRTGMSWDNRGDWHIDHIIPLSSANTTEEVTKLCHHTNLQPLWARENIRKSDKIKEVI